ncbi:unnamed protein product [Caenorhabditis auriculariae]|uniref:Uncharacterized protein n=1 Tax=Caenorhabditis auriculariae TaxID=2777116 RepID=A0A8S1H142_9PELO|nr:unnamed protein product [Caenorhabditis auriculariae]
MTRPTAPILTADYYTYSTYSQGRDFYGDFEPKSERSYSSNQRPIRLEPTICKNKSRCKPSVEATGAAHFITFLYLITSIIVLGFLVYAYYFQRIRNEAVSYASWVMAAIASTSVLMHVGIAKRQPFLCIPFVVLRTMEAFTCICLIIAFVWSIADRNNEFYNFFVRCTEFLLAFLPSKYNINLNDAAIQLCIIGLVLTVTLLGLSVYICRVSFECTMWVADELRARRQQKTFEQSRTRIASDELYCN